MTTLYQTTSPEATESLGKAIAATLSPNDVIAFSGDLGAGKTALTRGIAQGLGITTPITSPTYTIVNEYPAKIPLYHFDLYRLEGEDDLFDLGFEEYFSQNAICILEWSEIAGNSLHSLCIGNLISIEIKLGNQESHREFHITGLKDIVSRNNFERR